MSAKHIQYGKKIHIYISNLPKQWLLNIFCTLLLYEVSQKSSVLCLRPLTSAVSGVSRAERTHLLVLYSAGQRTQLTQRAPSSTPVTATLRLGDGVSVSGRLLAHRLQDLREAEALPVILRQQEFENS